jgi:hypothetical protein
MARIKRLRSIGDILTSSEMVNILEGITGSIAANVSDPNPAVRATLRTKIFMSRGGRAADRAVGQVGIAPYLRGVEAKRGPLARAVGESRGS